MESFLILVATIGFFYLIFKGAQKQEDFNSRFRSRIMEPAESIIQQKHIREVQVRGVLPIEDRTIATNLGVITSVLDSTDTSVFSPVFSHLDAFQELKNPAFQHRVNFGRVIPNQGLSDWTAITRVIPEVLQPPYSGNRKLTVRVRFVDLDNPPVIVLGKEVSSSGIIWSKDFEFSHQFKEKGYQEAAKDREEAQALSVQIAVAVAMADGSLDDSEGEIIQDWVRKAIAPFPEDTQAELKNIYNAAMSSVYKEIKTVPNWFFLKNLTERLNEIGETKIKYDAMELCYKVMGADGVADPEEMKVLHQIAEDLELDVKQIESMRDQTMLDIGVSVSEGGSIENTLGIDPSWSKEKIKAHLRSEFHKWNGRLNSLPEGQERESAQNMLDLLAEATRRYE